MNYTRVIKKGAFSTGLGYGMGLTVGLIGGALIVGGTMAAAFGGFLAVRSYLRKKKKAQNLSNLSIDFFDDEKENQV